MGMDISDIEERLSSWYEASRYDYDFGYDEGEEGAFEQCKQAMIADGYAEEDIDDDSINNWVWGQISADYDTLVNDTNAILDKYNPYSFDYFEFDISSDYFGECYIFNVEINLPSYFEEEEEKDSAYEEINKLGELLEEVSGLGWNFNYEWDEYLRAFHELINYVQELSVNDDNPFNEE